MHDYPTEPGRCRQWLPLVVVALILAGCGAGSADSTLPQPTALSPPEAVTATPTTAPPSLSTNSSTTTSTITSSTTDGSEVAVPVAATAPTIDGVLGPGEWDGASRDTMSDGATIFLEQFDGTLYVAVAGDEIGAVNVILGIEDEVWILHSSAALGSALYAAVSGSWQLEHGFEWCCRGTTDTDSRKDLFGTEGWQANIGSAGEPGTVEYQIALPWDGAAVAISSLRDESDKGFWPADLSAEARDQLLGVPPGQRNFAIEEWAIAAG